MDHGQFDSLTRLLADRAGSRRGIVQAMTAGVASLTLGAIGIAQVGAKKKKKKKKKTCKSPLVKCGTKCCAPPAPILRFAAEQMTGDKEFPAGSGDQNGSG